MKQIFWDESPLRQEARRMDEFVDPFKTDALQKNLTPHLHDELKKIALSKTNLIMTGFGPMRYGKSYVLIDIVEDFSKYRKLQPSIDHTHFTRYDMLDSLDNVEKGTINILDEQIHSSGTGSQIERHMLDNIEMVVGKYQLSFFFIAPKDIQHNYHFKFEVWQPGSDSPWQPDIPIEEQWKFTKSVLYSHKGIPIGYIITNTPSDKEFLRLYEAKKDKFIEEVKSMKGSYRYKIITKYAVGLIALPTFLQEFNLAKNNRLKQLVIKEHLMGKQISVDELKTLNDKIDYIINVKEHITDSDKLEIKKVLKKRPVKKNSTSDDE